MSGSLSTFNPVVAPSLNSAREVDWRVFEAEFGNGYVQRSQDGVNPRRDTWNLVWENLSKTEADAIENFFIGTKCTEPFWWTSPRDSAAKKWVVKPKWKRRTVAGDTDTIEAIFVQDFTLRT